MSCRKRGALTAIGSVSLTQAFVCQTDETKLRQVDALKKSAYDAKGTVHGQMAYACVFAVFAHMTMSCLRLRPAAGVVAQRTLTLPSLAQVARV